MDAPRHFSLCHASYSATVAVFCFLVAPTLSTLRVVQCISLSPHHSAVAVTIDVWKLALNHGVRRCGHQRVGVAGLGGSIRQVPSLTVIPTTLTIQCVALLSVQCTCSISCDSVTPVSTTTTTMSCLCSECAGPCVIRFSRRTKIRK